MVGKRWGPVDWKAEMAVAFFAVTPAPGARACSLVVVVLNLFKSQRKTRKQPSRLHHDTRPLQAGNRQSGKPVKTNP